MSKYHLTRKAQNDLIDIWDFTKFKWSKEQANKYVNNLIKEFEFLSNNKGVGNSCNHIRNGYFKFPIESHIIFYQEIAKEEILIIRVLHKSYDLESKF